MKLHFIGAAREVTGSCHYVECGGRHMLVDYGMEQGQDVYANVDIPVPAAAIDFVFLTHAHIDHSGLLPLLYARGFRGRVYATEATVDLCDIMLRDSAHIQHMEAEWKNRKAKRRGEGEEFLPLYTMEDAMGVVARMSPCTYGERIEVAEGIEMRFTDIGHLLGSASIELWLREGNTEKKLVFSGDIGNTNQPLIKDPAKTAQADYVIMESTYGGRFHPADRLDYVEALSGILQQTFDKGGNVVIPSFAVGRTQELLYFMRQIKEEGRVIGHGNFPVYVDSPLAVEATSIFGANHSQCYDREAMELVRAGKNPLSFPGLRLSVSSQESKEINFENTPKVIISASGMCEAGRIRHHLKHNLWRPECTVLFVGYQANGTLGRYLAEGAKEVRLFGEDIGVHAQVLFLAGLSGHADQNGLLDWLSGFEEKPRKVFLVHGEDNVCKDFAGYLQAEHGYKTSAPYGGSIFDLAAGRYAYEAEPVPVGKKAKAATGAHGKLVDAAKRLLELAMRSEGMANKDMGRLSSQIHSLCDKFFAH